MERNFHFNRVILSRLRSLQLVTNRKYVSAIERVFEQLPASIQERIITSQLARISSQMNDLRASQDVLPDTISLADLIHAIQVLQTQHGIGGSSSSNTNQTDPYFTKYAPDISYQIDTGERKQNRIILPMFEGDFLTPAVLYYLYELLEIDIDLDEIKTKLEQIRSRYLHFDLTPIDDSLFVVLAASTIDRYRPYVGFYSDALLGSDQVDVPTVHEYSDLQKFIHQVLYEYIQQFHSQNEPFVWSPGLFAVKAQRKPFNEFLDEKIQLSSYEDGHKFDIRKYLADSLLIQFPESIQNHMLAESPASRTEMGPIYDKQNGLLWKLNVVETIQGLQYQVLCWPVHDNVDGIQPNLLKFPTLRFNEA